MQDIHGGHRERVKNRFLSEGLDGFTPTQALELLLFYCIPRKDTNQIAHRLLDRFGTFSQVLETDVEELAKVEGVGMATATYLKLIAASSRYYGVDRSKRTTVLNDTEACGKYMMPYFEGRMEEAVFLLCLNASCKVLCCLQVGHGGINSAGVPIRKVVETSIACNASAVVLAHNHPSGIAVPSKEDILTTAQIASALDAVDITLVDHIVVAEDDFVSMVQSGYYRPGDCPVRY